MKVVTLGMYVLGKAS